MGPLMWVASVEVWLLSCLEEVFGALEVRKGWFGALECMRADLEHWSAQGLISSFGGAQGLTWELGGVLRKDKEFERVVVVHIKAFEPCKCSFLVVVSTCSSKVLIWVIEVVRYTLVSRWSSFMLLELLFACMSKVGADLIDWGAKVYIWV